MILRKGKIYSAAMPPTDIVGKQVCAYNRYVGKVRQYERSTGIANILVGEAANILVHINNIKQIWIETDQRVNDLPTSGDGNTRRLLKLDQWEYALENYVMTGEDEVQFGWWKESEAATETFFQLPTAKGFGWFDPDYIEIVKLARRKNMFGDYLIDDPEELVNEYFTNVKPKKKKK